MYNYKYLCNLLLRSKTKLQIYCCCLCVLLICDIHFFWLVSSIDHVNFERIKHVKNANNISPPTLL